MEITEVKVYPVRKKDDKLKAFATITIDDCFVVRDLKIINGNSGLFIAMPSRKKKDGSYADIAHPLNTETRGKIEKLIIDRYNEILAAENASQGSETSEPNSEPISSP